ncbi:hypothetical protein B0H14DRAFT_2624185 [Mycena olivaceomarginata]|nr:hypothetical protein B0H14DRAFT_2624185 [Mycena olivaceomarginata]
MDPGWRCSAKGAAKCRLFPGKIKPLPAHKKPEVEWKVTGALGHWKKDDPPPPESLWKLGSSVITQSGDKAPLGSWVFSLDSAGRKIIGHIHELLLGQKSLVTIEQFLLSSEPHPDFGWPILRCPETEDEDIAVVPHRTQNTRKRRRVIDSDSENSENENQEPEAVVVRQSTRQRRAPNHLDL